MEQSRAKDTIASLFNNRFDKVNFTSFISNLLNSASFTNQTLTQNNQIYDQFKEHIESLERLTTFKDQNDIEIDVLIVTLLKDTALDRARTMQRNFVASYLSNNNKDAALVAFVFPGSSDWRFSLISMESRYEGTKLVNESSPAKRWSFLVGKHEGSHTAQRQLLDILANDSEDPSLEELIEAFNIETVSKEFYEKYRELFDRMTEDLQKLIENDYAIEKDFREKQIKPEDFARKTMGQIAFLYFLQKKGWFGVKPGAEWGTGVRNFVRVLFERRETYGNNFFNDVLEPLFYEALALDRGSSAIYPKLNNVRMPFLNGGLFEPLNGYSWETTNITLPDESFSNDTKTKEGDIGDGILDIFDRYNFTVNESEPLEMEVAVDPEMLGKVFENLLPENIRKGKGAFYTPRPIVHYMCQESLINYLDTEMSHEVEKALIEAFIRDESSQLDLSDEIKSNAKKIDELLANIKVCDPAVGSGAFPLGLLNEIVKARAKIGEFIDSEYSIYDLKLHAISNSIYGVDLDPGAIEIAKLRFWLSLVVEEDSPSPLPNLDHKIMQGNSLISEYEGIKLFDDKLLVDRESRDAKIDEIENIIDSMQQQYFSLHAKGEYKNSSKFELEERVKPLLNKIKTLKKQNTQEVESSGLFEHENVNKQIAQNRAKALKAKVAEHISTHSQSDKERLKVEIEELKWSLIEITLQVKGELERLDEIKILRRQRIKPFFIWKLEFADVFKNGGGFDIVLANPPYIDSEEMIRTNNEVRELLNTTYLSTSGNWDIFVPFIEFGVNILRNKGSLCYIVPNKLIGAKYTAKLKNLLLEKDIVEIKDFSKLNVFDKVSVYPITFLLKNQKPILKNDVSIVIMEDLYKNGFVNKINKSLFYEDIYWDRYFFNADIVKLLTKLYSMKKIKETYLNITGAATVGEAYQIKEKVIDSDSLNGKKLINTGTIDPYTSLWGNKKTQYLKNAYRHPMVIDDEIEKINPKRLAQSRSEKIIIAGMSKHIEAYLDSGEYLAGKSTTIILDNSNKLLFLTGILNSKLVAFYVSTFFHSLKMSGGYLNISKEIIQNIPLPTNDEIREKNFIGMIKNIANKIKLEPSFNAKETQSKIDELVYTLYNLNDKEISVVENYIN
ncbi:Eco57I restriction-modification methylase domain-containing protein [Candidatus Thioglobus sp.]|nr:Eco57I restriction-modification methylase domain-containing protein [Candidatus Thioglobus sp.]